MPFSRRKGLRPISDRSSIYPMGRPRNSKTASELLKAGVEAFLTKGYHGTGLKEVLDAISIPKGSFYTYYGSKEEFAAAVIDHYSECFGRKMAEFIAADSSPRRAIRAFFEGLIQEFQMAQFRGGCLIANLAGELEESDLCRHSLKRGYENWKRQMTEVLRHGQAIGEFRKDLPADTMADMLINAWEGSVIRMKVAQSTDPLQKCLDHYLEDFFAP